MPSALLIATNYSLYTSFYNENFRADSFFPFEKTGPGKYRAKWAIHAADGLLGAYPADETGGWVVPAFKHPELYIGSYLLGLFSLLPLRISFICFLLVH